MIGLSTSVWAVEETGYQYLSMSDSSVFDMSVSSSVASPVELSDSAVVNVDHKEIAGEDTGENQTLTFSQQGGAESSSVDEEWSESERPKEQSAALEADSVWVEGREGQEERMEGQYEEQYSSGEPPSDSQVASDTDALILTQVPALPNYQ